MLIQQRTHAQIGRHSCVMMRCWHDILPRSTQVNTQFRRIPIDTVNILSSYLVMPVTTHSCAVPVFIDGIAYHFWGSDKRSWLWPGVATLFIAASAPHTTYCSSQPSASRNCCHNSETVELFLLGLVHRHRSWWSVMANTFLLYQFDGDPNCWS